MVLTILIVEDGLVIW